MVHSIILKATIVSAV